MEPEFRERRRSPRLSADNRTMVALHVSVPVRLLDLSSDGLLLACEAPLRVGSTVRVVSGLAGRRLEVELCVRHASSRRDEEVGGYVVGGSFPSFDPTARQVITALLGAELISSAYVRSGSRRLKPAGSIPAHHRGNQAPGLGASVPSTAGEPGHRAALRRSETPAPDGVRRERPVRRPGRRAERREYVPLTASPVEVG